MRFQISPLDRELKNMQTATSGVISRQTTMNGIEYGKTNFNCPTRQNDESTSDTHICVAEKWSATTGSDVER